MSRLSITDALSLNLAITLLLSGIAGTHAFVPSWLRPSLTFSTARYATEEKAAPLITGEELELLLSGDWEQPLVVDAYATWCGPCLLMAPEFEAAAQAYKGRVKFVKLDTDQEETMAARLNIMGLPTLLFLDKYQPTGEDDPNAGAKAVLKGRIEGAMRKQNIIDLYNQFTGFAKDYVCYEKKETNARLSKIS